MTDDGEGSGDDGLDGYGDGSNNGGNGGNGDGADNGDGSGDEDGADGNGDGVRRVDATTDHILSRVA